MTAAPVAGPDDERADVFIRRITLRNLLSFGPDETDLELGPLNVLIGPNGSGKSNLIAAIGILRAAPRDLAAPISDTGGIGEWLHKWESGDRRGSIRAEVDCPPRHLRYSLFIEEQNHEFQVDAELVGENSPASGLHLYYHYERGLGTLYPREGVRRVLAVGDLDRRQSVLSQLKDPHAFPEITDLGKRFDRIRIYREWSFGRQTPTRRPQPSDLRNDFLAEDASNLGLILNRLRRTPAAKKRLLKAARKLYDGLTDFDVIVEGGTVQVFLEENARTFSWTR